MLPYATIALELARERERALDRAAARHRLLAEVRPATTSAGPRRIRRLVARPLWAFGGATRSVADAACAAATRLEARSA
jgi:hypothetical protein